MGKSNLSVALLKKENWKKLIQRDLPESMAYCIIGRMEAKQRTEADAIDVAIIVIHETGHVNGVYSLRARHSVARSKRAAEHRDWSQVLFMDGWYQHRGGRIDLHSIWNGNLTAQRHTHEILRPHDVPYSAIIGDSFLLNQDNVKIRTARLLENFLEEEKCSIWSFAGMFS
ncbi:hypothetical protein TNCV_4420801 [Trichonephila clavipes]|nr:hypothetical protein TNCV_4420801 [Trichonephila clavipes]